MKLTTLTRTWRRLQSRPSLGDVEAAWRDALGGEWDAIRRFLKPTDDLARSYPCPSPRGPDCPRGIVRHDHDRFVAFCRQTPPECERLDLRREDVIIHRFDVAGFAAHLARTLDFTVKTAQQTGPFHSLWHIATYVPVALRRFPVFLVLAHEKALFLQALDHLLAGQGDRFILLAPTDAYMDEARERLMDARGCAFIPLNEALVWDGRTTALVRPADELLAGFRTGALPDGHVEAGHVAKVFTHERTRGMTPAEVDRILGPERKTFDLVVDGRSAVIWHPRDAPRRERRFRVKHHVWILLRLVEARVLLQAKQFDIPEQQHRQDDAQSERAKTDHVQRTRRAIEPGGGRGHYRYIKTVTLDNGTTAYQWAPDPGLRYALIFPLDPDD